MAKKSRTLPKALKAALAATNGDGGRYGGLGVGSRAPGQHKTAKITLPNAEAFARLGVGQPEKDSDHA